MKKKLLLSLCLFLTLQIFLLSVFTNAQGFDTNFSLNSQSILLTNIDSDTVVFSKNQDTKMYPASTTKIMTYILTSENISDIDNTFIEVKKELIDELLGSDSSVAGLKPGETFSVRKLLECLMISSGNDAALVLADYIGNESVSNFVEMMNQKAQELNCSNTHFMNPHGLYDPDHYTTASDLSKITRYALNKFPEFIEITSKTATYLHDNDPYPLATTNRLIDKTRGGDYYYQYAKGIKTGHTDESGNCLVSLASKNGFTYLCVALGAKSITPEGVPINGNGSMIDTKNLYEWAFDNFNIKTVAKTGTPISEIKVNFAWNKDNVILTPTTNATVLLPKTVQLDSIEIVVEKPDSIDAPVEKGQKIATAIFKYANQEIGRTDLVVDETVNKNLFLYFLKLMENFFSSPLFIISILILISIVILYLLFLFKIKKNNKRKNRRKKYIRKNEIRHYR